MKATKVDGIFDKDPVQFSSAKFYENITYNDVLTNELKVMDSTAISLAKESKIPIYITNIFEKDSFIRALKEDGNYSKIS